MNAPIAKNAVENCRALFGEVPEDVISPIKSAAEALGWLEEIFKTISREALHERNGYRLKRLADAGAYLAFDFHEYAGCRHEEMLGRLRGAGVARAEGAVQEGGAA